MEYSMSERKAISAVFFICSESSDSWGLYFFLWQRVMAEDDGAAPLEASVDASGIAAGPIRSQAPGHSGTPGPSSALAEQSFNTSMRSLTARAGVGGTENTRQREIEEVRSNEAPDIVYRSLWGKEMRECRTYGWKGACGKQYVAITSEHWFPMWSVEFFKGKKPV